MNAGRPRLSLASLDGIDPDLHPGYDPAGVGIGIVHLGIGAFARAHIAHYTDRVLAKHGGDWGILGVSQRSTDVPDRLRPQDGLYTVLQRDGRGPAVANINGAIRGVACATDAAQDVVGHIAARTTAVVTITVTEKGYRYDPGSGHLLDDNGLAGDLAGRAPRTVVGQIVRGLQQRFRGDVGPIAIMSCDNLPSNGPLLHGLVQEFLDRLPDPDVNALRTWIADEVAFPHTMVDRIVPAATDEDRQEVARVLGRRDDAAVVTEPFTQWVIEDRFTGFRPAWEDAGAIMSDNVSLYEVLKLRMLNGTHSLIAYLGILAGYEDIAETLRDPLIEAAARTFLKEDAAPAVVQPPGVDLDGYGSEVLQRFRNPALGHLTRQVAMDGSHKLPPRLLGTARARLADGATPQWVALAVAAWIHHLGGLDDGGREIHVNEPLAATLRPLIMSQDRPEEIVHRVLAFENIFGEDLGHDERFTNAVTNWLISLSEHGVRDTLAGSLD